jgi:hypothetical protein
MNKEKQIELITEFRDHLKKVSTYSWFSDENLNNFLKSKGLGQKELGHVYKDDKHPLWMAMYCEDGTQYGFDVDGNWFKEIDTAQIALGFLNEDGYNNTLATPEEWEARLKEEAKRLGLKKGEIVKSAFNGVEVKLYDSEINWSNINKELRGFGCGLLYNGIWATIVEPKQEPTESEKIDKDKLVRQLFIGKVSEVIGIDKTTELLNEAKEAIMWNERNQTKGTPQA